jgi:WD40-like Beta Propeller Repeat
MTRYIAVFCWFFLHNSLIVNAQFDKANDLYSAKKYAAAIPHFEQGLLEKDNISAKTRLANCYRLTNKMEQAEALYSIIVVNQKAKSDAFLHYAETLMSNGKYDEAKKFFLEHFSREPLDSTGFRMARNCDLVPKIKPYFSWVSVEEMPFNTESDDNSAIFWRGGVVFTSDRSGGANFLKHKAGWTGRDYLKLWWAKYDATGAFGEPRSFSSRLNQLNKNTANASFTADGERIFFTRNADFTGKDNTLNLQIFDAENGGRGQWKSADLVSFCTPEVNFMHPSIAPDGSWLVFSSNKNGTIGGFDLWIARKKANGNGWMRPENLGAQINTAQHEGFPFIATDGRLFFCSKGKPGFGGFDIFVTKLDTATGQWATPANLGRPINGSHDDLGFSIAANDSIGFFTSSRNGADDDIYLFWLGDKKRLPQAKMAESEVVEALVEAPQLIENQQVTIILPILNVDSFLLFAKENRLKKGQIFQVEKMQFDSATAIEPTANSLFFFEKVKTVLDSFPKIKLEIGAFCEPFLKEKTAQKLTNDRANFLKNKLIEIGLPAAQISAKGFGSKKPLVPCPPNVECPPEIIFQNRRTEIKVIGNK